MIWTHFHRKDIYLSSGFQLVQQLRFGAFVCFHPPKNLLHYQFKKKRKEKDEVSTDTLHKRQTPGQQPLRVHSNGVRVAFTLPRGLADLCVLCPKGLPSSVTDLWQNSEMSRWWGLSVCCVAPRTAALGWSISEGICQTGTPAYTVPQPLILSPSSLLTENSCPWSRACEKIKKILQSWQLWISVMCSLSSCTSVSSYGSLHASVCFALVQSSSLPTH